MAADPASFTKTTAGERNASGLLDKLREKKQNSQLSTHRLQPSSARVYPKVTELSNQLKQVREAIEAEKDENAGPTPRRIFSRVAKRGPARVCVQPAEAGGQPANESAIEYTVLKRDAETNRQLYQDLCRS